MAGVFAVYFHFGGSVIADFLRCTRRQRTGFLFSRFAFTFYTDGYATFTPCFFRLCRIDRRVRFVRGSFAVGEFSSVFRCFFRTFLSSEFRFTTFFHCFKTWCFRIKFVIHNILYNGKNCRKYSRYRHAQIGFFRLPIPLFLNFLYNFNPFMFFKIRWNYESNVKYRYSCRTKSRQYYC